MDDKYKNHNNNNNNSDFLLFKNGLTRYFSPLLDNRNNNQKSQVIRLLKLYML